MFVSDCKRNQCTHADGKRGCSSVWGQTEGDTSSNQQPVTCEMGEGGEKKRKNTSIECSINQNEEKRELLLIKTLFHECFSFISGTDKEEFNQKCLRELTFSNIHKTLIKEIAKDLILH